MERSAHGAPCTLANTVSYDICGGYNNQGTAIERMAECPI